MSDRQQTPDDDLFEGNGATLKPHSNGQLVTPTLSPISEHGQISGPVLDYEADDEDVKERENAVKEQAKVTPNAKPVQAREDTRRRKSSNLSNGTPKLSPQQIHALVSAPDSLPVRAIPAIEELEDTDDQGLGIRPNKAPDTIVDGHSDTEPLDPRWEYPASAPTSAHPSSEPAVLTDTPSVNRTSRMGSRSTSASILPTKRSHSKGSRTKPLLAPINIDENKNRSSGSESPKLEAQQPSPLPSVLPVPPLSLPTYLQLELSSERPSALYIHRSATSDFPYESSQVKFQRLLNFLLLPPNLEHVLWFGTIACLDAWLYTFTILPLRFFKAVALLLQWIVQNTIREVHDLCSFVYSGIGRLWKRRQNPSVPSSRRPSMSDASKPTSRRHSSSDVVPEVTRKLNGHINLPKNDRKPRKTSSGFRHRRTRSTPSALLPNHKADMLQGLLIVLSCFVLMRFDASRMYHSIRGQSAIKLYVIYNVLEVFDRLFSALGQDILECLFSKETLERNEHGRSKIMRPLWMFLLALVYNVIHGAALFYQVVTLNVAVNSYSNALLTLLMSNQFVEIKGTVFKKFEKENLFQLTCADVVERFQLWLMMLIIALRNIVEVGGLSISITSAFSDSTASAAPTSNSSGLPFTAGFVIPKAFTLMPKWTGEVLGPFLIVLGSEMLVDWCKHAYITKFNNVKPTIYGRFLDVLAKDYYSHAFADQNLTKRLGLPVIPLSCLFIRACVQTYHMFLAIHMPLPLPSTSTSISVESEAVSTAALQHIDHVFRRALGRSTFGAGSDPAASSFSWWSIDDVIALATMITFFLAIYLILLAFKLVLGMILLSWARGRYKGMKEREHENPNTGGRRVGGWGVVEVNEDKRPWIYEDDPDGLRNLREKEERAKKGGGQADKLDGIDRYMMAAKRIW